MNDFANDPIILNYINTLRQFEKNKKSQIQLFANKATIVTSSNVNPIEEQTKKDFNAYIKLKYPEMAYIKGARVKIKHIPDDCGLENKGTILKVENKTFLVHLDNDKQAQYEIEHLELL